MRKKYKIILVKTVAIEVEANTLHQAEVFAMEKVNDEDFEVVESWPIDSNGN